MVESIVTVLMRRDGISKDQAEEMVEDAKTELYEILEEEGPLSERAYNICADHFGLEPDYLMELL